MINRFLFLLTAAVPLSAQLDRIPPPNTTRPQLRNTQSVENGQRRFRELCTGCHGREGQGGQGEGKGPNLMNSWEVRRAKDTQLFDSIKNGIKETAMPPFQLPDTQISELVGYVRSLNAPASSVPISGDAAAGEAIFFGRGRCGECHMVRDEEAISAPTCRTPEPLGESVKSEKRL
jgi:mono/diheme cytochrome c family protein